MEEKLKYLEFIQNVITRMNSNSFSIKTWMVTVLAAFIALFANNPNEWYLLAAIIPTIIFWFMDARYLKMEKQYRRLYADAVLDKVVLFDMNANNYKECYFKILFNKTIAWIYLPIVLLLFLGWLIIGGYFCQ